MRIAQRRKQVRVSARHFSAMPIRANSYERRERCGANCDAGAVGAFEIAEVHRVPQWHTDLIYETKSGEMRRAPIAALAAAP